MNKKPSYKELEEKNKFLLQELETRDSKSIFNSFFDNNKAVMLQVDSETKQIVNANQTAIDFYAYSKDNLLKKTINDLNLLDESKISKLMKEAIKREANFFEFRHLTAKKEIKNVEVYASPIKFTDKIYLFLTIYDVTSRKTIETELEEKQLLLKEAQKISKLGHWELDLLKNKLFWSDQIYRIFGLQPQEFTATYEAFLEKIHPEDRNPVNEAYAKSLKTKQAYEIEHRILLKTGELKYVIEKCDTIFNSNGKPLRSIGTVQDITRRKKLDSERQEQNKQLKELNATKDKFFSIIAHDLKSPFSSMLGFSELLIRNFDEYDISQQKEFLNIIHESVQNTYKLLENLLLWSRSQRGTIDFTPEKISLYALVQENIKVLNQTAISKSISLNNEVIKNSYVLADENMLSTIVRNLISNSLKFTEKNGTISINSILVEKQGQQSYIQISVIDNGVGIPDEKLPVLFKVSENVSTEGTENEMGTGLGLILCKEFVNKQNGEIWAKSKVNKGSEFIFTLPVAK